MRLLVASLISILAPLAAQASDAQLTPSYVYIVSGPSIKSCYGGTAEANRIIFPLLTVRSTEKDPITLMDAKIVLENEQILGGRHECNIDQAQLATLLHLPGGVLHPGTQALSACSVSCGGITYSTSAPKPFVAKGTIEILGVSTSATGVQTPIRLGDEFAAELFGF